MMPTHINTHTNTDTHLMDTPQS